MSYKFLSTIQAISATFTGNSVYSNSTPNRTVKLDATGLYLSRISDGGYASTITADGSMYYNTRNNHIFQGDSSTKLTIVQASGNVLIGTTTDGSYKLDVNGTGRFTGTTNQITAYYDASNYMQLQHNSISVANTALLFNVNSAERMRLLSTGNLLIGTTTDAGYKLDVIGTIRSKDPGSNSNIVLTYGTGGWLQIFDTTPTETIRLRAGGGASYINTGQNFLIGTTTDAGYKLDVNGTGRFQGNVTTAAGTKVTVGSIEIFDNTAGIRQINALSNQIIQVTAGTTNVTLNNSNSNGNIVLNSNGSGGYVILRPNGSNSGIYFSGSNAVPSYNQMTFYNNRNDGNKSAIINTVDFAASGSTPVDLYLYAGKETVLNNQGNIYLAYDGTNTRGSVNIGGTSTASAILNLTSTTQGFLPPRMTSAQRTAISTPAVGLIVYQTDGVEGLYVNTSGGWKALAIV